MNTINALNKMIISITMEIKEKYPELEKYLNEMPITIPNQKRPEINMDALQKHYDSLVNLLIKYKNNHI
jgi:hypothetical protein